MSTTNTAGTSGKTGPGPSKSNERTRSARKVREGYVVSDKMDKTVVVALQDRKRHPRYGKIMRFTKRVKAHDDANTAGTGDLVRLMETRPLASTKHWRLVEVLQKAK